LSETTRQTKVRAVEVVAEYKPDEERMLEALMLVLGIDADSLPAAEHEDAIRVDSVS
jgi:hypothetical protein